MNGKRVPWVVGIWRTPGGPGAGGGRPHYDTAHVFESAEAFRIASQKATEEGRRGQWIALLEGDPRSVGYEAEETEMAMDRVFFYPG